MDHFFFVPRSDLLIQVWLYNFSCIFYWKLYRLIFCTKIFPITPYRQKYLPAFFQIPLKVLPPHSIEVYLYMYCEIIINRGVLIIVDFVVHLNHEDQNPTNTIFSFIVACNVRNHEYWCQRIKVFSQYIPYLLYILVLNHMRRLQS